MTPWKKVANSCAEACNKASGKGIQRWLKRHYTIFEALQAGLVMGTGDIIAQKLIEKKEVLDKKRLAVFSGLGFFFVGPIQSTWFHFLDSRVSHCWNPIKRGFFKMALDQIVMPPTVIACVISIMELTLGSGTFEGVKEEMSKKYPTILTNNYKLWPAVQTINFTLTPVQLQVLVVQLVSIAWNAYISYAKNEKLDEEEEEEDEEEEDEGRESFGKKGSIGSRKDSRDSVGSRKDSKDSVGSRKDSKDSTGSRKDSKDSTGSRKDSKESTGSRKDSKESTGSKKDSKSSTGSRKDSKGSSGEKEE